MEDEDDEDGNDHRSSNEEDIFQIFSKHSSEGNDSPMHSSGQKRRLKKIKKNASTGKTKD